MSGEVVFGPVKPPTTDWRWQEVLDMEPHLVMAELQELDENLFAARSELREAVRDLAALEDTLHMSKQQALENVMGTDDQELADKLFKGGTKGERAQRQETYLVALDWVSESMREIEVASMRKDNAQVAFDSLLDRQTNLGRFANMYAATTRLLASIRVDASLDQELAEHLANLKRLDPRALRDAFDDLAAQLFPTEDECATTLYFVAKGEPRIRVLCLGSEDIVVAQRRAKKLGYQEVTAAEYKAMVAFDDPVPKGGRLFFVGEGRAPYSVVCKDDVERVAQRAIAAKGRYYEVSAATYLTHGNAWILEEEERALEDESPDVWPIFQFAERAKEEIMPPSLHDLCADVRSWMEWHKNPMGSPPVDTAELVDRVVVAGIEKREVVAEATAKTALEDEILDAMETAGVEVPVEDEEELKTVAAAIVQTVKTAAERDEVEIPVEGMRAPSDLTSEEEAGAEAHWDAMGAATSVDPPDDEGENGALKIPASMELSPDEARAAAAAIGRHGGEVREEESDDGVISL